MKNKNTSWLLVAVWMLGSLGCADNDLEVNPEDQNFPLQLILDSDEGAALPDEEDYGLEVTFADYIGTLPDRPIIINYAFEDVEGSMSGVVEIDQIIYEYEEDECTYERSVEFTREVNGQRGTITIPVDPDLGTVPESFEIVFKLPGLEDTEGSFSFVLSDLVGPEGVEQGFPRTFEYEVLDADVAGEWELEISSEEEWENFKQVFAVLNSELEEIEYTDITGKVVAEFEFAEMKFEVELAEEEEVVTCSEGEIETETENKIIEIEAEYEAEDGEMGFEGSHLVLGDDGEITNELDFQIESSYEIGDDILEVIFFKVVDEDNFEDGSELFRNENGIRFLFVRQ